MRTRFEGSDEEPAVQFSPLIDIVFLLLIFFLVASTLKKAHKEVEITLPEAAVAEKTKTQASTVIIEVARGGEVYIDSEPVTTQLLHTELRRLASENPNRRVRIDGDKAAPFQYIVHVLEVCKFNQLTNVGVRTRD